MLDDIPQDWPNREQSQIVPSGTITWHLQEIGRGPDVLFLHGAGASTHSWAPLIELAQQNFTCIACDLPGHGFTDGAKGRQLGLSGGAEEIVALLTQMGKSPAAIVGHSAGAAIALRLSQMLGDVPVLAINGAFQSFEGLAGMMFPIMARSMVDIPLVREFMTIPMAQGANIERLIGSTGSRLSPEEIDKYRFLLSRRAHVTGTLGMMGRWDLRNELPNGEAIKAKVHFVQARDDGTVPMEATRSYRASVPGHMETVFDEGGHLIHETDPDLIYPILLGQMA